MIILIHLSATIAIVLRLCLLEPQAGPRQRGSPGVLPQQPSAGVRGSGGDADPVAEYAAEERIALAFQD